MLNFFRSIFGSRNERNLRRYRRTVARINALEDEYRALPDVALRDKNTAFKSRCASGESLDSLLPEAFAAVREASRRTLGMRHFDVQLIGGIVLHQGNIAEMATGEGKTLAATLPLYLNALDGRGAHLVTVNSYLAERDAGWMGPIYEFLGLSVGVVLPGQNPEQRRAAYAADISYGTNNDFGFDYLRDNMCFSLEDRVQRGLYYAIVDEVDSILIDEARTPLIISGATEDSSRLYLGINRLAPKLQPVVDEEGAGHYRVDEKKRQVELSEEGHSYVEGWLSREGFLREGDSLYAAGNLQLLHHVHAALRAHALYRRDVDYIVQRGEVVLIDEHTGRTMSGRRLSEGLHQALEAKEGVAIQSESHTLASTTFQNYFRLYDKLAGMTGTADTEAAEFHQIYGLEVIVTPTNQPVCRRDDNDLIYMRRDEKFAAVVEDIRENMERGAPVLVGTASIENSEHLSRLLHEQKIPHEVLNAKQHRREAEIIAQAGYPGAVTIATNMAGRGTDIVLGGNVDAQIAAADNPEPGQLEQWRAEWRQRHEQVVAAGGLHVIGTERHESRRIDNQLRGRAGRQGDPGASRFYLSMEDDLMRIFLSERVKQFMQNLGLQPGEAIEHRMLTSAIEKAQRRVEAHNFEIRKQLLEYDDIADVQRKVIYGQRIELLQAESVSESVAAIRAEVLDDLCVRCIPPQSVPDEWDLAGLRGGLEQDFNLSLPVQEWLRADDGLYEDDALQRRIRAEVERVTDERAARLGEDLPRLEKYLMLQVIDTTWKQHLAGMDHLRQGIHLRAYAQRNPKEEYKREAYTMFQELLWRIKQDLVRLFSHLQLEQADELEREELRRREEERHRAVECHAEMQPLVAAVASGSDVVPQGVAPARPASAPARPSPVADGPPATGQPAVRKSPKIGRNASCPCGSGRKYKHCHGR